jgi:hypothetical protein
VRFEIAEKELHSLEQNKYFEDIDLVVSNETGKIKETAVQIYEAYRAGLADFSLNPRMTPQGGSHAKIKS